MKEAAQVVAESLGRIFCLAAHVWREGVRQRLLYGFGLVYLLFLGAAGYLRTLHFGAETNSFVVHLGLAGASLVGSVFTVLCTVPFFLGEFESRAVLTLFTKPVGRFEYLLGKWLGISALLGLFCMLAVVLLVLHTHLFGGAALADTGARIPIKSLLAAGVMDWLKCSVLAASVLLVSTFLRGQLLALMVGFVVLILGHVRLLFDEALRGIDHPVLQTGAHGLARLIPDFRIFTAAAEGGGMKSVPFPLDSTFGAVAYGALYLLGTLLAAGLIFRRREL